MYTEENERGRFPLRDILLKAIVVIIFLILIIFVITKVTSPKTLKTNSSTYDKVFSENLKNMEKAAFIYFTKDKLPTEVASVKELTLRQMINSNLLAAFTDSNGKACDVNNSYIKITKNEEDYTLRVNLKCSKKEDYSLIKVGEYDYCKNDICKKDSSKDKKIKENKETKQEEVKEVEIKETQNNSSNSTTNVDTSNNKNNNSNNQNTNNDSKKVIYEYKKVTSPVLSSWSSWSDWKYNNYRFKKIDCNDNDIRCLKEIDTKSPRERVGVDKDGNVVYATVHYYRERTRNLISSGSTDIKWSTYNDTNLLNQGYHYTGNYK